MGWCFVLRANVSSGSLQCISIRIYEPNCVYVHVFRAERCWQLLGLYRGIHKSVKYFKNSQQIDYVTDHCNSYADRERTLQVFFLHISQMLNVSTFGNTADIYAIVHLVPHACQHIRSTRATAAVIRLQRSSRLLNTIFGTTVF
jgi:hypothetical protein